MGVETKIEWCDRSASPWHGCSRVHAGCDNCYAEAMAVRNPKTLGVWGDQGTRVKSKSFVANLRKWNREAEANGKPISVFPSICDPFEDRPELVEWRNEMFATIDECPWIRLLLLTKRPENVRRMWPGLIDPAPSNSPEWPGKLKHRKNVWLLTSVSDQPTADAMIPELLKCRDLVPVLGVSAEPLLGPVNFNRRVLCDDGVTVNFRDCLTGKYNFNGQDNYGGPTIDWVIVGGESGHGARPCDLAWIRSIVGQCEAAGVACFVKQLGASVRSTESGSASDLLFPGGVPKGVKIEGSFERRLSLSLRDSKGGDWSEWPGDLRVREWPEVAG